MSTHYSNLVFSFRQVILISLLLLLATNVNAGKAHSFKFTKFGPSTSSKLTLQGTALFLNNNVLALTLPHGDVFMNAALLENTGRVLYNKTVPIWDRTTGKVASFVTSFCFVVEDVQPSPPADGIVFFLSPDTEIPNDSSGGNLGVSGSSGSRFVGVEFDSYSNEWDPSYPHIGIDVHNLVSSNTVQWNRESGSLVQATILYNGKTKTLRATLTNKNGTITSVDQFVDLKDVLPEKVNVGISGTTGGDFETHEIHSWSFTLKPHHTIDIAKTPRYGCDTKGNN